MKHWFIADTHYGHSNILNYECRPFKSLEEMEEKMVDAWNSVVEDSDTVWFAGDFSFKGYDDIKRILLKLKGNIKFIKGNHDKHKTYYTLNDEGIIESFDEVGSYIKTNKLQFYISHFPMQIGERPRIYNIHGHIHSEYSMFRDQINVGVDSKFMHEYYENEGVNFGTPVSLEYILNNLDRG